MARRPLKLLVSTLTVAACVAGTTLLAPPGPAGAATASCVPRASVIPPDPATDTFTQFRLQRCGVPDLDQHRKNLPADGDMYCGPTSAADWILYLADRGAPGLQPGPGQATNDAVTQMLIGDLGTAMGTHPVNGTTGDQILAGIRKWFSQSFGVLSTYYYTVHADWGFDLEDGDVVHRYRPTGRDLTSYGVGGSLVMTSLGYYNPAMPGSGYDFVRAGGHVQSVVSGRPGSNGSYLLGINDPASSEDPRDITKQSPWTTDLIELSPAVLKVGPDQRTEHIDELNGSFYTNAYLEGALLITPNYALLPDPVLHDHAELRRSLGLPGGPPRSTTISLDRGLVDLVLDPRGNDHLELHDDGRIVRVSDLDGSSTPVATVPGATSITIDDQLRTSVIDSDGRITVLDVHGNPVASSLVPGATGLAYSPRLQSVVTYDAADRSLVALREVAPQHLEQNRIALGDDAPSSAAALSVDPRSGAVGLLEPGTNRLVRVRFADGIATSTLALGDGAPLAGLVADAGGGWYSTRAGTVVAFDAAGAEVADNPYAGRPSSPMFEVFQPMDVGTAPVGPNVDPLDAAHGDTVRLTQAAPADEVGDRHAVTAVLTGADGSPLADRELSWTVTGANPRTGTVRTDGAGRAVVSWTGTAVGDDELFVRSGTGAVSGIAVNWVERTTYPTSVAVSSAPTPSVGGRPITLTARVASPPTSPPGGVPTGTVQFVDDGRPLGTVPVDGNGRAALTTSAIPGGTHRIVASYLPSAGSRYLASSGSLTLPVDCSLLDVACILRVLLGRPHG